MATVVFREFEWDEAKAATNETKHQVRFEEATTVFADRGGVYLADAEHQDRIVVIGMSDQTRVLTVVTAEPGERTRIISARRATSAERRIYEEEQEP